ncbi:hypothetical protein FACS1894124_1170 [Spirochaetia bacterium]|nr:hypothetical protein FACS1894124_1170 [Spirochaetia bacterium]
MTVLRRNLTLAAVSAAILIAFIFAGCPMEMTSVIPLPGEKPVEIKPPPLGREKPATGIHFLGDTSLLVFSGQESETLTAVVAPEDADIRTVYWASSNPAVVTVRSVSTETVPMGKVVPTGLGEAKVYAQVSDGNGDYYTAICLISVLTVPEPGIVIEGAEIDQFKRLAISSIGMNKSISARVLHGTGTVTWSISDAADPVVLLNGAHWDPDQPPASASGETVTVTGRKEGTAYLTAASAEGKTDTIMVIVEAIAVDTIEITKPNGDAVTSLTINKDASQSVMAKLTPANTTYTVVKWEIVDGADIVDISTDTTTDGSDLVTVTAKTAGTALIRATSEDGKSAVCAIRVPMTLNPSGMTLILDTASFRTRTLTASVAPGELTWSIGNPGIADYTVDPVTGVVTVSAVSPGQTTLKAATNWQDSDGQHLTAECLVTVLATFAGKTLTLNVPIKRPGLVPAAPAPTTGKLTLTNPPSGIHWENDDAAIAELSANTGAEVTAAAKATGQTFVMALNADNSLYEMYLIIVPLRFEYTSRTIAKGVTELLYTTVDDVTADLLDWTSSNTAVAAVDGEGRVTALTAGKTVITATTKDGRQTASCTVTVPLTISPAALTLFLNDARFKTGRLTASIAAGQADWSIDNTNIADYTVDPATGAVTVTALAPGQTTITVTTKYLGDEGVPLTVRCPVRVLDHFGGQKVTLNAPIQYPAAYTEAIQPTPAPTSEVLTLAAGSAPGGAAWSNDNDNIAVISPATGDTVTASAVSAGTTFLLVEDSNGNLVTVYQIDVPIRLEKADAEIALRSDETLYTTVGDANKGLINWTSEDDSVASVDSDGKVHGNTEGYTTIHAEYEGLTVSCEVTVPFVTTLTLYTDETKDIPDTAGLPPQTSWVSYNTSKVTVDQDGKVTGIASTKPALGGHVPVLVTASVDGHTRVKCTVSVEDRTLTLDPAGMTLYPGESTGGIGAPPDLQWTITPAYNPPLASPPEVVWYSENPTVVAVDQNGKVTALEVSGGPVKVWAKVRGAGGFCAVTVVPPPTLALFWNDTGAPWTGSEPAIPDTDTGTGTVTWVWDPQAGGGPGATDIKAMAMAKLTNAPPGFDHLQWSFDSSDKPPKQSALPLEFVDEWNTGAPLPASSPVEMSISFNRNGGGTSAIIYVWNCDAQGNRPSGSNAAEASFTVNVTEKPSIALFFDFTPTTGNVQAVSNAPIEVTQIWKTGANMQLSPPVYATVTAVLHGDTAPYDYLQWSFAPFNPGNPLDLSYTAGRLTLSPQPVAGAQNDTVTIKYKFAGNGTENQTVYVRNCDINGNPGPETLSAEAEFILDIVPY